MVRLVRYHGPYLGYSTNVIREGHAFDYTSEDKPRKKAKPKKKRKLNNTCQQLFKGK